VIEPLENDSAVPRDHMRVIGGMHVGGGLLFDHFFSIASADARDFAMKTVAHNS
jgi:hypothetical protein